jgi:hypothetical protein
VISRKPGLRPDGADELAGIVDLLPDLGQQSASGAAIFEHEPIDSGTEASGEVAE